MPARSGADSDAQWPPRSPHEALLSTPGGRERLRRMAERASPSPSPSKRGRFIPALAARSGNSRRNDAADEEDMDLDEDEDEEVLQLKLQAIQAKLKLKKLQSAKAKKGPEEATSIRPGSASIPPTTSRTQVRTKALSPSPAPRSRSQAEVQVPASPVRRAQTVQDQRSPSRVRLGIDKGWKGKDVSLKRAPSLKKPTENQNGSQGGYLRRAHTPSADEAHRPTKQERPMTFSERLAAARSEESSRQERRERIKQVRSNAFELGKQEMEQFKNNPTEIPDIQVQPAEYSREEVMAAGQIKRSNTMPSLKRPTQEDDRLGSSFEAAESRPKTDTRVKEVSPSEVPEEEASAFEPYSSTHLSKRIIPHPVLTRNLAGKKTYVIKDLLKHVKAPDFELPEIEQDIVVFGILASKSEPRSHKTTSNLKEKVQTDPSRGKYMTLKLVDLQWELDLFLFNSGFERYWKLTPGTLLAILNPTIMPPPPGRTDTGRFSLVINSGQDTILEVGNARDLGFCKSIKKDGEYCNSWVNRKRTEFCEFHMNHALSQHRQARQDINAFNTGLGPRSSSRNDGGGGRKNHNSYRLHQWENHADDPKKARRGNYDRATQSQWFISKPSAASLLDNEVLGGQVAERHERSEALRRRLATEEKERDLMKKLGKIGSGAGREYMQQRGDNNNSNAMSGSANTSSTSNAFWSSVGSTQTSATEEAKQPPQLDAKTLGLIPAKGREPKMHLSPIKRKRAASALSSSMGASSFASSKSSTTSDAANNNNSGGARAALGWGGGLRDKLARMKEGERLNNTDNSSSNHHHDINITSTATTRNDGADVKGKNSSSGGSHKPPARKKTRFVTEKGIREAGRESLGTELTIGAGANRQPQQQRGMVMLDDDEDDDLLILP
ncbi:hypothetical protein F4779DRAFT_129421 [Xylariaceae sp. FL0662B]|nr:hypothetical protein F4779DRAFT_129421 [Xylariaceae sp. FL0662B]